MMRVSHVIAEYSAKEAMGRTVREAAMRVPGTHSLVTARLHDGADAFTSVAELGGAMETFPLGRGPALQAALAAQRPDVVHVHGGALAPLLAASSGIRDYPNVMTMYAWPRIPPVNQLRAGGVRAAWRSNVLRPRVGATTILPASVVRAALRRAGTRVVLTPDPAVRRRLSGNSSLSVERLPSGAPEDSRRASFNAHKPVIVFAGRAESVRGVDTLMDAFPAILDHIPGATLKLLLIPRPELGALRQRVAAAGISDRVVLVTEPVEDLLSELSDAQVGAWPFKFDYTTSPPAMAVAEALSVGLPVVATNVGCVRAVVEPGVNGATVAPGDAPALASALLRMLTDRSHWERMAAAGPTTTQQLSWSRAAETTEGAYRMAVAGSAA